MVSLFSACLCVPKAIPSIVMPPVAVVAPFRLVEPLMVVCPLMVVSPLMVLVGALITTAVGDTIEIPFDVM